MVDYKSNALPTLGEDPSPADYGPGPLDSVMLSSNYVLQATMYQVALHRYLQWRLPGYDPEVHLGGSMYLFVRGMVGADTPVIDGERCGVARWHPPASFVVAVSDLFKGGAAMTAVDRVRRRGSQTASAVVSADGLLAEFNDAGVLGPLDVLAASTIARILGETDEQVILAAAMAVRGTRVGHVCISLSALREAIVVDGQDPEVIDALPWPDPSAWESVVQASCLVGDGTGDHPLVFSDGHLYLERYYRYEEQRRLAHHRPVRPRGRSHRAAGTPNARPPATAGGGAADSRSTTLPCSPSPATSV